MTGHCVRRQPCLVGTHAWGNRQGWPVSHSTSTKSWFHSRNKLAWRIIGTLIDVLSPYSARSYLVASCLLKIWHGDWSMRSNFMFLKSFLDLSKSSFPCEITKLHSYQNLPISLCFSCWKGRASWNCSSVSIENNYPSMWKFRFQR